jgi:hypothetical protein
MRNKRLALVVAIGLALAMAIAALVGRLVYASRAVEQAMIARRVSAVRIVRTSVYAGNHIPPLDRTVTKAPEAQQLYNALVALPVVPQGTFNCPADFGIEYRFTFFQGGSAVATASIDPHGCQIAKLPDGSTRWALTDTGFWQVLAEVAGVPVAEVLRGPSP